MTRDTTRTDVEAAVASARWYHTMELPGGVITPGEWDLPAALGHVPLPISLAGKRCLDVGTRDGFWAFEMERRGAAEVVAIDLDDVDRLDWPEPRPSLSTELRDEVERRERGFDVAHRLLGSSVRRRDLSVYDLDPTDIGRFDFAFIGTLLLHLRDPVGALMSIRRVLDGELISNDAVSITLTVLRRNLPAAELIDVPGPFWWRANVAGRVHMCRKAGFEIIGSGGPYLVRPGPTAQSITSGGGPVVRIFNSLRLRYGMPHSWVRCRPLTA